MRSLDDRIAALKATDELRARTLEAQERSLRPYSHDLYKHLLASVRGTQGGRAFDFYDKTFNPGQRVVSVVRRVTQRVSVIVVVFAMQDGDVAYRLSNYTDFSPYTDEARDMIIDRFLDSAAGSLSKSR